MKTLAARNTALEILNETDFRCHFWAGSKALKEGFEEQPVIIVDDRERSLEIALFLTRCGLSVETQWPGDGSPAFLFVHPQDHKADPVRFAFDCQGCHTLYAGTPEDDARLLGAQCPTCGSDDRRQVMRGEMERMLGEEIPRGVAWYVFKANLPRAAGVAFAR